MVIRFNRKASFVALSFLAAGLALPGLSSHPALAAPSSGAKKAVNGTNKPGAGRRGRGGEAMRRMKADLNLTDAQVAKLKPILKASSQQRRAVRMNKSLTPEQRKSRLKQIRAEREKKFKAILTPAQQNKLKQMAKERRKNRAHSPQKPKA